jgi:hypothetical protein
MACQEDSCWRCGAAWITTDGPTASGVAHDTKVTARWADGDLRADRGVPVGVEGPVLAAADKGY